MELINPFTLAPSQVTDRQGLQLLSRLENHFSKQPETKTLILSCNSFGCHVLDRILKPLLAWLKSEHPHVSLQIFARSPTVGRLVESATHLDNQHDWQIDTQGPKLLYKACRPESAHPPVQPSLLENGHATTGTNPQIDKLVVTLSNKETLQPPILTWIDWLETEDLVAPENIHILFDQGTHYHDPAGTDPFRENQIELLKQMICK